MRLYIILIAILICLLLLFNSYYWQIIPLCSITIWLLVDKLFISDKNNKKKMSNLFWGVSIPVFILGTFVALTLIPIFNISKPKGSYSLGTKYFTLRDSSRNDMIFKGSSDIREIYTQVWYPAKLKGSEKRDIYIPGAKKFSKIFATSQGIFWFPFVLNHLGKRGRTLT